jgi:uncharacterized membrane protein YqaE (UPF0057 family)
MLVKLVLAVIFPPLAVLLTSGIGFTLVINILLTVLGYLPGIIHALWVVTKKAEKEQASS